MGTGRVIDRLHRGGIQRLVVIVGLAGFVVGVYSVLVLGIGVLIGHTDSPSLPLSVLATTVVALLFAPVQTILERVTSARLPGGVTAPYDLLRRFSRPESDGDATEDLPAVMSRLLAEATGAQWAQVWLSVSGRLTLAATWPADSEEGRTPPVTRPDARDATGRGRRALTVQYGEQSLGVLRLQERPGLALTTVEERLFVALASQAGLMLRLVAVRAELEDRHQELVARAGELQASRDRLIQAQDTERRRLERDIHDGAQQHLVALAVNLRVAQTVAASSPERAARMLGEQAEAARVAIATLSSLSRGIYPRILAEEGLLPALRAAVGTSAIPVTVTSDQVARLPASVEAALYFCCIEAVQNAAKHSAAAAVAVRLSEDRDLWWLVVTDDGAGFDPARMHLSGMGLANMRDRLDVVSGTVDVRSVAGGGTTVSASVARTAAPGTAVSRGMPVPTPGRGG
ncbi:MAG TPA: ATP-binding protein [Pedococcus sp.]|nr:ATP-binding protein [Pedococcus sp.]